MISDEHVVTVFSSLLHDLSVWEYRTSGFVLPNSWDSSICRFGRLTSSSLESNSLLQINASIVLNNIMGILLRSRYIVLETNINFTDIEEDLENLNLENMRKTRIEGFVAHLVARSAPPNLLPISSRIRASAGPPLWGFRCMPPLAMCDRTLGARMLRVYSIFCIFWDNGAGLLDVVCLEVEFPREWGNLEVFGARLEERVDARILSLRFYCWSRRISIVD